MSNEAKISNGAAAVLSLVFPGLGQICQGRVALGIISMLVVPFFTLLILGFVMNGVLLAILLLPLPHLFQVIDTARYQPKVAKAPVVAPVNAKLEAAKERWLSEREAANEANL